MAGKADDFARVVGHQADLAHPEVGKNLRAHSVLPEVRGESEFAVGLHRIQAVFLQLVSVDFGR